MLETSPNNKTKICQSLHVFFDDQKIALRKIAPRMIARQQIPHWVRIRVWVRVSVEGNLLGGNLPGAIFLVPYFSTILIYKVNTIKKRY